MKNEIRKGKNENKKLHPFERFEGSESIQKSVVNIKEGDSELVHCVTCDIILCVLIISKSVFCLNIQI